MQRTISLLCILPLFLAACGGGDGNGAVACTQDYWDGTVGLCLPDGWEVVDRETLRLRGVGEDTLVAFQAVKAASGQFPTVAVTREQLTSPVTPVSYSEASIRSVTVLPGYELLDTRPHTVDGTELQLHIFSAQPISEEPKRRFFQVSTVHDGAGYTVTATTPVSVENQLRDEIQAILNAVTFTGPQEAAEEES